MKKQYIASFYFLKGKELLLVILFLAAFLTGMFYSIATRNNEKLFFMMHQYMLQGIGGTLDKEALKNATMLHGKHLVGMWIGGLFQVTRVITYGIFFLVVFAYGYTMTNFVLLYGIKGILIGFMSCGIQAVLIIFLGMYIIHGSLSYTNKQQGFYRLKNYISCLGVVLFGVGITGVLDVYMFYLLKPFIIFIIGK